MMTGLNVLILGKHDMLNKAVNKYLQVKEME